MSGSDDERAEGAGEASRPGPAGDQSPLAEGFSEGVAGAEAQRVPKGSRSCVDAAKKVGGLLLGGRGRLTRASQRQKAIGLINEPMPLMRACSAPAARSTSACAPSSAGANAWVMGTVRIAVKAAAAMLPIASRPRNVSGFCSPAINPSTPRCQRVRSCRIWLTGIFVGSESSFYRFTAIMTRCTDVIAYQAHAEPRQVPRLRARSEPGVELLHLLFDHKSTWDLAVPLPGDPRLKQQNISLGCH